jgi:hypothetical protein
MPRPETAAGQAMSGSALSNGRIMACSMQRIAAA